MIKCKDVCPQHDNNTCCKHCAQFTECEDACSDSPEICGRTYEVQPENGLMAFEHQHATVLQEIVKIVKAKKALDAQESELKKELQKSMERYGIQKFTSDVLNITYVGASEAEGIDTTKLKAKYPHIAEEFRKITVRKPYIKITVKG